MDVKEYMTSQRHLSAEDVAAYVDGAIGGSDRERIEGHAAECEDCRREIADVTVALRSRRRTPSRRVWIPAIGAAVIVGLLLVEPFWHATGPEQGSRFRGRETTAVREDAVELRTIAPQAERVTATGDLVFVWQAGGSGASYQLTLTDGEGTLVWTLATTDTVAPLPDTIELQPASRYHWYVDAMFDDGRNASSEVRSFTVRR